MALLKLASGQDPTLLHPKAPSGVLSAGQTPRRVLLVKLSAMGDQVCLAAAVRDIRRRWPEVEIDWAVDERFADIARLHRDVQQVFALPIKRCQRGWRLRQNRRDLFQALLALRRQHYDLVLDAQGLWKSALIARLARSPLRVGFQRQACGEHPAALFYTHHHQPSRSAAVARLRDLAAFALGSQPYAPLDYGLAAMPMPENNRPSLRIALCHTASKAEKRWEDGEWVKLGRALAARGFQLVLPWGTQAEQQHAQMLAEAIGAQYCEILPYTQLADWPAVLASLRLLIGVDSGLLHLAAAHGLPTVGIFVSTHTDLFSPLPGRGLALGLPGPLPDSSAVLQAASRWLPAELSPG